MKTSLQKAAKNLIDRWAVVAGDGTQQIYLGREAECQNMARKFAGAFLDGACFNLKAQQVAVPQVYKAMNMGGKQHDTGRVYTSTTQGSV